MTIYFDKHRKRWRYDFEHAGERHFGYCVDSKTNQPVTSRRAAVAAEGAEKARAKVARKSNRAANLTLAQVMADLVSLHEHEADWPNKERYMREILAFFGPATPIASIDGAQLQNYVAFALKQPVMIWTGGARKKREHPESLRYWKQDPAGRTRSPATVNRYLPLLRMALDRAAKTRDPLTGTPVIVEIPKVKDLPESKRKARPTPDDVLSELMLILPQHVIEALTATLFFGFRRGEVFSLTTSQVDLQAGGIRLFAEDVKDDEDVFMPGAPQAMEFMRGLVDQARTRGTQHLFTWRRFRKDPEVQALESWRPIQSPKTAWRTAMKKIEKRFGRRWRWHDVRAAFITHVALTSGGVAAQALARHSDYETTQGYIEVADTFRRAAANRVAERPSLAALNGGKSPTQESHTPRTKKAKNTAKSLK